MSVTRSPTAAAVLSFILPGLGQASLGAVRRGILVAIPAVTLLAVAAAVALAGYRVILDSLLRPEVVVGLLLLNLLLAGYHVAAITDAYGLARRRLAGPPRAGRRSVVAVTVLLALTLGLHGSLEVLGYRAYDTLTGVFVPAGPDGAWSIPEPSFEPRPTAAASPSATPTPSPRSPQARPATPGPTPSPTPSPTPTPVPAWAGDGRLDLLLIGSDAGPDRWSLRTDTIIVLSVDVASGRAALFGIPRNLVGVPLPPESAKAFRNGRFPGLLNALYVYAMGHASKFPGGDARGFRAVAGAVQELVGVRLDGVVVVNLAGFVRLVDALGGLWIDVPERLVDRNYPLEDGSGHIKVDIRPGCQLLDGRMALAYARSRHQDSDYGRMRRQQAVLVALARQVDPIALVPKVPELLDVARKTLWTTIRPADVGGLAELAATVDTSRVRTVRFVPPGYPSHLTSAEISRIQRVVRRVFRDQSWAPASSPAAPAACP